MEAEIDPEESVETLKNAVQMYRVLKHPNLIRLIEDYRYQDYYAAVFEWTEGECLFDHWNFEKYSGESERKSPMERFKNLPLQKKLSAVDIIFSFLANVAEKHYTAVDFYDGSLIYNFEEDKLMICDIDLFSKQPAMNEIEDRYLLRRVAPCALD